MGFSTPHQAGEATDPSRWCVPPSLDLRPKLTCIYMPVYTSGMRTPRPAKARKPKTAKLFRNGGSQAVRLPREYRFEGLSEVVVRREGRRVILEPADEWSPDFLSCLGSLKEHIPRPKQEKLEDLRDPFA